MRALRTCLLWAAIAVLCTAIVICVQQGFVLVERGGVPAARLPDALLGSLAARAEYLAGGALAGLFIGLVSLIPAPVRASTERLLFWAVLGALSGAFSLGCAAFLYEGYHLHRAGISMDSMPFLSLLTEKMGLQSIVPYGAIVGAAVAVIVVVLAMVREGEERNALEALASGPMSDPDELIRAERSRRAQQYLADRGHHEASRRHRRSQQPG